MSVDSNYPSGQRGGRMKANAGDSVHTTGKESQQVPTGKHGNKREATATHSPIVLFWAASGTVVVSEVPALPWLRMIPLSVSNCSSSCVTMPLVLYLTTESDTWSHHTHTHTLSITIDAASHSLSK